MPRRATVTSRDDLVSTATTLVVEHGVSGLRLLDLAHAAGVSVGTVYNHFPSKAHLLAAVAARVESSFVAAMDESAPADQPLRPAVPVLVTALLDTADRAPAAVVLAEPVTTGTQNAEADRATTDDGAAVRAWIANRVVLAQQAGEVGDIDPRLVADLAFGLVRVALQSRGSSRTRDDVALLLGAALTAMLPAPAT